MQLLLLFLLLELPITQPFEIVSSDAVFAEGANIGYNTSLDGTRFGIVETYRGIWYVHGEKNDAVGYWGTIEDGEVTIEEFGVFPGQGPSDIPHRSMIWFIQPLNDQFIVGITNGEVGIIQLRYYNERFELVDTKFPKFAGDGKTTPEDLQKLIKKARGMWDSDNARLQQGITQDDYNKAWDAIVDARLAGGFISGSEFQISRDGKRMIGRLTVYDRITHKTQPAQRSFGYYQWIIIDVDKELGHKIIPVVDQSARRYSPQTVYELPKRKQEEWFEIMNQDTIANGMRRNVNWFRLKILEDGTIVQVWPSQSKLKIMDPTTYKVVKTIELDYPAARVIDAFWKYYGRNSDINSPRIKKAMAESPKYATFYESSHNYWNVTKPEHRTGVPREMWPGITDDCPSEIRNVLVQSKPYFDKELQFDASVFSVISTGESYWVIGISEIPEPETPTESILTVQEYSTDWKKLRTFNIKNNNPNVLSMSMQTRVYAISPKQMVGLREDDDEGLMVSLFNLIR